jgi:hypothetical protein
MVRLLLVTQENSVTNILEVYAGPNASPDTEGTILKHRPLAVDR